MTTITNLTSKLIALVPLPTRCQQTATRSCSTTPVKESVLSPVVLRTLLAASVLALSGWNALAATVSGSPTNCVDNGGVGTITWSNPGRAMASDNSYATASVNDNQISHYLQCTGYGFAIPANAVINGITVNVERNSSTTTATVPTDYQVRLVKAGVMGATDRATATNYTTADVVEAHGGATDLWGDTWTPSNINASNFGVAFSTQKPGTGGGNRTVSVDYIEITIDYSMPFSCTPPSNTPAGVSLTCQCDTFQRATLDPSTIFGASWKVSSSDTTGIVPSIVNPGYLRLTNNTGANAKAATVPGIFPAAGNYISVEFQQYAYNGSGADGIAVTLSDYAVPAVPGAFGGSLGYAQKSNPGSDCTTTGGCPGFAGGWIGVAMDEFGNYSAATEGRIAGPGVNAQSVGVRGPGSGQNGYRWMGGALGVGNIDNKSSTTPSTGNMYQVIVDARNSATNQILVYVNRDSATRDGSSYSNLFGGGSGFNAYTEANYAVNQGWITSVIPTNWQISFTGSTGGSTNIHEISSLRICAQNFLPPTGGTASGFSAIDEAYPVAANGIPAYQNFQTGHIFMKLIGPANAFKLWVAALNSTGTGISNNYSTGNAKYAQVNLVDNSDGVCGPDSARTCNATCTNKVPAEAGATQIVTFAKNGPGASLSPAFTINSSWKNLIAVVKECTTSSCSSYSSTTPACSVDSFSVRPLAIAQVTSSDVPPGAGNGATNALSTGGPTFKAGSGNFSLSAYTIGVANSPSGYNGVMKVNSAAISSTATYAGVITGTFPAATPLTPATANAPASTATGITFTYSEVGGFTLPGYNPATDSTSRRGVYDGVATADECKAPLTAAQCDALRAATWTGVDSISTKSDCIADSYSNTKDSNGKYGCNFGLIATSTAFGRFIPDHFSVSASSIGNRADYATAGTIAAGTSVLTLGSAAGVKVGDVISITGAGAAGATFSSVVAKVVGLTVTLSANASTSVTGVPVYVAPYTYMGEPMNAMFTLTAQSAGNTTTKNYEGSTWAKLDPTVAGALNLGVIDNPVTPGVRVPLTARISTTGLSSVTGTFVSGIANVIAPFMISRGTSGDGPYSALDVGIAPVDSDGVTTLYDLDTVNVVAGTNNHTKVGNTQVMYGRIKVSNNYGSELLPLSLTAAAQYYTANGWVNSVTDNITQLTLAATYAVGAGATAVTAPLTRNLVSGVFPIELGKPSGGATGIATISPKTNPLSVISYLPITSGTATFGVYKNNNGFIYRRESY